MRPSKLLPIAFLGAVIHAGMGQTSGYASNAPTHVSYPGSLCWTSQAGAALRSVEDRLENRSAAAVQVTCPFAVRSELFGPGNYAQIKVVFKDSHPSADPQCRLWVHTVTGDIKAFKVGQLFTFSDAWHDGLMTYVYFGFTPYFSNAVYAVDCTIPGVANPNSKKPLYSSIREIVVATSQP